MKTEEFERKQQSPNKKKKIWNEMKWYDMIARRWTSFWQKAIKNKLATKKKITENEWKYTFDAEKKTNIDVMDTRNETKNKKINEKKKQNQKYVRSVH